MKLPRSSGVLLHPTSLPGPFGVGDLGPQAYAFADFLKSSGQSLWQVLPLGPTGYGDSPYACYSAFAGNTLLVSPALLVQDGLVTTGDLADLPPLPEGVVDYQVAPSLKESILRRAFASFTTKRRSELFDSFETFGRLNALWLEDYALFRALKD